jgi:hypothetical protein
MCSTVTQISGELFASRCLFSLLLSWHRLPSIVACVTHRYHHLHPSLQPAEDEAFIMKEGDLIQDLNFRL